MCLATACLVLSLHTLSEAETKSKAKKSNEPDTFRGHGKKVRKINENMSIELEHTFYLCTVVEGDMQGHCNRKWLFWLCLRKFALNSEIILKTDSNSPRMAQEHFQIDF